MLPSVPRVTLLACAFAAVLLPGAAIDARQQPPRKIFISVDILQITRLLQVLTSLEPPQ